jgi:hypothetical protein
MLENISRREFIRYNGGFALFSLVPQNVFSDFFKTIPGKPYGGKDLSQIIKAYEEISGKDFHETVKGIQLVSDKEIREVSGYDWMAFYGFALNLDEPVYINIDQINSDRAENGQDLFYSYVFHEIGHRANTSINLFITRVRKEFGNYFLKKFSICNSKNPFFDKFKNLFEFNYFCNALDEANAFNFVLCMNKKVDFLPLEVKKLINQDSIFSTSESFASNTLYQDLGKFINIALLQENNYDPFRVFDCYLKKGPIEIAQYMLKLHSKESSEGGEYYTNLLSSIKREYGVDTWMYKPLSKLRSKYESNKKYFSRLCDPNFLRQVKNEVETFFSKENKIKLKEIVLYKSINRRLLEK